MSVTAGQYLDQLFSAFDRWPCFFALTALNFSHWLLTASHLWKYTEESVATLPLP